MGQLLFLTEEEVAAVLMEARKNSVSDFALLLTAYELGTRPSEAAALRREDVAWKRKTVTVRVLKRSKRKKDKEGNVVKEAVKPPAVECPVSQALLDVLRAHLAFAPASEWIFPKRGEPHLPIDRYRVKYVYYKAAHAVGLGKHREWHPHLLRHTKGTLKALSLAKKGVGALEAIKAIQETLRHASEGMALRYVHATSEATQKSHESDEEMTASVLSKVFASEAKGSLSDSRKDGGRG